MGVLQRVGGHGYVDKIPAEFASQCPPLRLAGKNPQIRMGGKGQQHQQGGQERKRFFLIHDGSFRSMKI